MCFANISQSMWLGFSFSYNYLSQNSIFWFGHRWGDTGHEQDIMESAPWPGWPPWGWCLLAKLQNHSHKGYRETQGPKLSCLYPGIRCNTRWERDTFSVANSRWLRWSRGLLWHCLEAPRRLPRLPCRGPSKVIVASPWVAPRAVDISQEGLESPWGDCVGGWEWFLINLLIITTINMTPIVFTAEETWGSCG